LDFFGYDICNFTITPCGDYMNPSRVLIIAEDPNVGKLNEIVLTQAGYIAKYVQTLTEGQSIFEAEIPDLLVMEHDGLNLDKSVVAGVYHNIRSNPLLAAVPIIVVRCERRASRQLYTTEIDPALIFLPIVYSPEELIEAAERLMSAARRQ
jgi:DNA-binding response OmpR family regulator